jgi:hypothetical protein
MRVEELRQFKNPLTSTGIKPAIFLLLAECQAQ